MRMYTEPTIYNPTDLSKRAFVSIYIHGKRWRFYNGNAIGIICNPNKTKSIHDRRKTLERLSRMLYSKLEKGWHPDTQSKQQELTVMEAMAYCENMIESEPVSHLYKRDLLSVIGQLKQHASTKKKSNLLISEYSTVHSIEDFLNQYRSSGTYFMNKRRNLSAVFRILISGGYLTTNPIKDVKKIKAKAVLHKPYESAQLKQVMTFLEKEYPNLHICCLLMMACFLRPHQEIRLLCLDDISPELDRITLDGESNKSGRIRSISIPYFIRPALQKFIGNFRSGSLNLFTGDIAPFNESYFNLQWSRAKHKLKAINLVEEGHTLYSFRHTSAIEVFKKTNNIKLLQHLMGHSNVNTTLIYLRGLRIDVNADVNLNLLESLFN